MSKQTQMENLINDLDLTPSDETDSQSDNDESSD